MVHGAPKPSGLALVVLLAALGVASAHVAHGITVDDDCLIEGKGGCKDLGTVTAGSVEACYEQCRLYWVDYKTSYKGCASFTWESDTKDCHLCTVGYPTDEADLSMIDKCAITEASKGTCTFGIVAETGEGDAKRVHEDCDLGPFLGPFAAALGPFLGLGYAVQNAGWACAESSVTCSGACSCEGGIITDGPDKYAPGDECEVRVTGALGLEPIEVLEIAAGDSLMISGCMDAECKAVEEIFAYEGPESLESFKSHSLPIREISEYGVKITFKANAGSPGDNGFKLAVQDMGPKYNLEAFRIAYKIMDNMPYMDRDSTWPEFIDTSIADYLDKIEKGECPAPTACNNGALVENMMRTILLYSDKDKSDRALVAGTVAKDLWDDHGIWLVENGVIDESSANALKIYLESVPYHMRSSAGGRGVAILAPDTFVCTKNNLVVTWPGGGQLHGTDRTLVPGQADVIVDHFARGWPTFPLGPAGGGCQDQPDFLDSEGEGCDDHVTFGYCVDGGYGPGWDATWGQFSDYAVDGIDASQACCACGGGNVLGPGALGPGKGRARFSIPMPSVSYGQPALYKKMRAGDSPMWKSNTRYNQTHESRIPHIVQPSLFGDTAFFTASGDLFLQTMRHEFPHAIQNEESTRTPRMNEMFKNILAASKTADDLYAPGLGDAGFDYLTKFPEEIWPNLMSAYTMSSSKLMNEAMKKNATSKVPVAWMLYVIEMLADVKTPNVAEGEGGGEESSSGVCGNHGEICSCTGTVALMTEDGIMGLKSMTGGFVCEPSLFEGFDPEAKKDYWCTCFPYNNSLSRQSTMYEYDLYGQYGVIDGPARPFYVTLERIGWIKYEKNLTLLNETFNASAAGGNGSYYNETYTELEVTWKYDSRIKKLTIPGCDPYTFSWGEEFSNASLPDVFVPTAVYGPTDCDPNPHCTFPDGSENKAFLCACNAGYSMHEPAKDEQEWGGYLVKAVSGPTPDQSKGWGICDPCPVGTFKKDPDPDVESHGACSPCPKGTYNDETGKAQCAKCPAGKFSTAEGANSSATCAFCPIGKFSAVAGATGEHSCLPCPAGEYRNASDTDATQCIKCPATTYSALVGATGSGDCIPCAKGKFSTAPAGAASEDICQPCPKGTYSDAFNTTACTECAAGKFNVNTGASAAAACVSCAGGTFQAETGKSMCSKCQEGKYSNVTAATICIACSSNSTSKEGSQKESDCHCRIGWTGTASLGNCTQCDAGKFKTAAGSAPCTSCPATTTTADKGAISYRQCVCNPGYNGTDGATCSKCPIGKYKDAKGSGDCTACAAHYTTDADGKTAATDCQCGKGYENKTGTPSDCIICPVGKYNDAIAGSCQACPKANMITAGPGSISADACVCKEGYTGVNCNACPAGKFKTATGSGECTACEAGTYAASTASTSCTACPAGKTGKEGATQESDCCNAGIDGGKMMKGMVAPDESCPNSGYEEAM